MSWNLRLDFWSLYCISGIPNGSAKGWTEAFCRRKESRKHINILVGSEFVLLEGSHELRRQAEGPQAQASLGAAADVVHKSHCPLVHLLLVKELVLDHVHVDEVAHVGAGVPSDVVRIHVDLPQHTDHLGLVDGVGLRARGGGGRVGGGIVKVRLRGHFDDGEREAVRDLEAGTRVHTDDRAGRSRREGLGAVLDDFHHHLESSRHCMSFTVADNTAIAGERGFSRRERSYQGLDLDGREGNGNFFPAAELATSIADSNERQRQGAPTPPCWMQAAQDIRWG